MKTQRQHFFGMVLLAIMSFMPLPSMAEYYVSEITLSPGQQTKIYLPDMYVEAMNRYGGGYPYTWSSDNSSICTATTYRSRTYCSIYARSLGTTKIHYHGEYYRNGVIYNYDCYWDVTVSSSGGEGEYTGGDIPGDEINAPTDSWATSGNYTISWYNKNENNFTISTAKELAGMAYLVNNKYADFSGKTITLSSDIDLSGKRWAPIGNFRVKENSELCFKGVFDGQGHTINGIILVGEGYEQRDFGLFGYAQSATFKNLNIQGVINVKDHVVSSSYDVYIIGGLVGEAKYSTFEQCRCEMDIKYQRTKQAISGIGLSGATASSVYAGGIAGLIENSTMKYCIQDGSINCILGPHQSTSASIETAYIGGMIARADKSEIAYCENNTAILSLETQVSTFSKSQHAYMGGILGYSNDISNILCCRNLCNFSIKQYGQPSQLYSPSFAIGGISNGDNIINSYSKVSDITISGQTYSTFKFYTTGGSSSSKANYSNSDVSIYSDIDVNKKIEGSTAFTSDQMQTPAFLEELNMYSMLEMDGPVWTQDEGGFPYIAELHKSCLKGDVNDDGTVDIADAVCIVNYVVSKPNTTFNEAAADVNDDGEVDIADAVKIVNLVVGKIDALSRPAKEVNDEKKPQKNSVKKKRNKK